MKKKWQVSGEVTISTFTEVWANTAEEAVKIAKSRGMLSLCHHCATGEPETEWVTSGELDGDPTNIRVEEA